MERIRTMLNEGNIQRDHRQDGFTLVELMIVILIFSVVMGGAYTVFSSQQKTYTNQQAVADIQQNLRAGMYYLTREVRLAGYSENDTNPVGQINIAGQGVIRFTMDINNTSTGDPVDWDNIDFDGDVLDPGEDITYALADDGTQDGIADSAPCSLIRTDNNGASAVLMNNVEAIGYAYAYDSDNDGRPELNNGNIIWAVDTDTDGDMDINLDMNGDGTIGDTGVLGAMVNIDQICMVRIWILVRSSVLDSRFTDSNTYQVGLNQVVANDNYRRRLLSASMMCRNMGGF